MALNFAKKKTAAPTEQDHDKAGQEAAKSEAPKKLGWAKTGQAAKAALAHEDQKAEERKAEQGKLWRFFLGDGEEGQITFLDGKLDKDGMLDIPIFYEHRIRINGEWQNYICTAEIDQSQPCPVCEKGDKPALVGVMTVLDHRQHTIKKGPNAGKMITNTRKLFVAKRTTIQTLTKLAVKRGGLAGCTFDVSRSNDRAAAVGDMFDFTQKFSTLSEIAEKFSLKLEDVQPANVEEEIIYRSPEKLIELGVGKAQIGIGYEGGAGKNSLKDEL
jgi:hypothetical protein